MKKNRIMRRTIGLTAAVLLFVFYGQAQDKQKLKEISATLGAQNINSSYGGFLDLTTGEVYVLEEAAENQEKIDIVYTYGKTTKINFLAPSSTGLSYFGKRYKENTATWEKKNKGSFIILEDNRENVKLYRNTKTTEDLKDLYVRAFKEVSEREDYDRKKHGPRVRVGSVNMGDIVIFRSRSKDLYAIGRVVDFVQGYQGSVRVDFKVTPLED